MQGVITQSQWMPLWSSLLQRLQGGHTSQLVDFTIEYPLVEAASLACIQAKPVDFIMELTLATAERKAYEQCQLISSYYI